MQLKIKHTGDTIVEVLLSIAIAGLAIGTSYAIANKSLQKAVNARERNEALNFEQAQIAALKLRFKAGQADLLTFNTNFGVPSNGCTTIPGGQCEGPHYCLNPAATDPSNPNWNAIANDFSTYQPSSIQPGSNGYNSSCQKSGATTYYLDISTFVTPKSQNSINRTNYQVTARWDTVGGGLSQSSIFYRF